MLEGQQAATENNLAAHLDDAHGEPVPGFDRLGRGVLDHPNRLAATQKVAGEKGLAGLDIAGLVEAHRRRSERGHVGAVGNSLLPAAALEIVVDDVAGVVHLSGEEVLEGASPERHRPVSTDSIAKLLEACDAGRIAGAGDMLLQHVRKGVAPRVAGQPFHQTGERMG